MVNNHGSNNSGSKFMTGLMWGAIIGGGLVFLLGTKKGKRIIKTLSEEGIELSQLLGNDDEDEEVEEVIVHSTPKINKQEEETSTIQPEERSNGVSNKSTISKIASHRFFKRTPKR